MDATEFSENFDLLTSSLKPFALRLTKNVDDANDLLQETALKAFNNRNKFAPGTNLKAWMYTIMKNTFITNYQKKQRRNTFIDNTENLHYLNSMGNITENNAYGEFAIDDIKKCMARLDENYRIPFIMYFRGFKYHEIAIKLEIPIGTVKNRIHIARKELKYMLKNYKGRN